MTNRIWVVLQLREGQVSRISWEALAAAQRLAAVGAGGAGGGAGAGEDVARRDVAAVLVADQAGLERYTPGAYIGALAPAIAAAQPALVLFPHTYQTVDFVPRLAQQLGAGLLPEVTGFEDGAAALADVVWTRPVMGGK